MMRFAPKTLVSVAAAALLWTAGVDRSAADPPASGPAGPVAARAWLGVELEPMPPALAEHLQIPRRSPMVRNVYVDSPADACGLQPDDILLEVDGRSTEAGIEWFGDYVRSRAPGDTLRLTLIRKGQRQDMAAALAALPADRHELRPKFDARPLFPTQRMLGLRGKILRPGHGGKGWIEEDLGELFEPWESEELRFETDDLGLTDRLMSELRRWMGDDEHAPPGRAGPQIDEAMRTDQQGWVVHVTREPDGRFTVRRYQRQQGRESAEVKTYPDFQALRDADPQAAGLLAPAPSPGEGPGEAPPPPIAEALREYLERLRLWERQRPEFRGFREWDERFFRGPMEQLREHYGGRPRQEEHKRQECPGPRDAERRADPAPAPPPPPPPGPPPGASDGPPAPPAGSGPRSVPGSPVERLRPGGELRPPDAPDPPRHSFHCLPDGRIDVTVREPEGELRLSFESIERFRAEEPALYQRYLEVREQARR